QKRSDDRTEQRADAAEYGPEYQFDGAEDVENLLGKKIVIIEGKEHAGDGGHPRRELNGDHFVAERINAEGPRGALVLADRLPIIAEPAAQQKPAKRKGDERQREHNIIEHSGAAAQVPKVVARIVGNGEKETAGAADPAEMIKADAGKFGK